MPGIWDADRRGIHTADDGGGAELQVETAGMGAMPRMREGIGKGVTTGAPPKPLRRGEGRVRTGGRQRRRGQKSHDLKDDVSHESRTKSLPSQRVYWPGGYVDRYAGAIIAPARLGHRGDTGGGQNPSPTMPSV